MSVTQAGLPISYVNLYPEDQHMLTYFPYDFATMNYNENATKCMYNDLDSWQEKGCTPQVDMERNLITCDCDNVEKAFYALVYDSSGIWKPPVVIFDLKMGCTGEIWIVAVFVMLIALLLPICSIMKDSRDYEEIRNNWVKMDDDVISKISEDRRQPREMVIYLKPIITRIQDIQTPLTFSN